MSYDAYDDRVCLDVCLEIDDAFRYLEEEWAFVAETSHDVKKDSGSHPFAVD